MLDAPPLPPGFCANVELFRPTTGVTLQGFQSWQKPRGISMVYMLALAGGGGGGGGFTRSAGADGGGGGSGACSGMTFFLCSSLLLPDLLYVQVGHGGQGGAANTAGDGGVNSYVMTSKTLATPNVILSSGGNVPGGGGAGTGAAGGGAGSVPSVPVTQPIHCLGMWRTVVGQVGLAGGAPGVGGSGPGAWQLITNSIGAPGGGVQAAATSGGSVNAQALTVADAQLYYAASAAIAAGGTSVKIDGGGSALRLTPFFNAGGAGGAGINASAGGAGGSGGYGSGGGGGGSGTTGGKGGNGGPGLVLIISW